MPKPISTTSMAGGSVSRYVRQFLFYGVDLAIRPGDDEARGQCPNCGRDNGKFSVNVETGKWGCFPCGFQSNEFITFQRWLYDRSVSETSLDDLRSLADERKILSPSTISRWGLARSPISGDWLVPGYNVDGLVTQVYKYATPPGGKKPTLMVPLDTHHAMFGVNLYDQTKGTVYLCEGPWDAMAVWEILGKMKTGNEDTPYMFTGSDRACLLADANVVGLPGANMMSDTWLPMFSGKDTRILFDNDHPRVNGAGGVGVIADGAGWAGARRISSLLVSNPQPARSVGVLVWGDGVDSRSNHAPELPDGWDVRDQLSSGGDTVRERISEMGVILDAVKPIPKEWIEQARNPVDSFIACDRYETLRNALRGAMKWMPGLDRAMTVMLASILSTKALGDPIWVMIISPPSTGKSTLCEVLSVNRKYVTPKDSITSLFSGYQSDRAGTENVSLAPALNNRTLIVKDADTVLKHPNLQQILSQFRALYDKSLRTQFGNRMSKDYEFLNVTVIWCGTGAIRQLDTSELGERFITCKIMDEIDPDLEDEILVKVAYQAERALTFEANGKPDSQDDPAMLLVKRLAGGYVEYLRENANRLINEVTMTDRARRECIEFGKFVAYMRARPSGKQDEVTEREFAARLVKQMVRLSMCLAAVLNKSKTDDEVINVVRRVAIDTSHGKTLSIARCLAREGRTGAEVTSLAIWTAESDDKTRALLKFMRKIGIVETYRTNLAAGVTGKVRWRLTERVSDLYDTVMKEGL